MYRQQAERLAAKIRTRRPDLCIDVYQEEIRGRRWIVNAYDPATRYTAVFESEREASTVFHPASHLGSLYRDRPA
jgi:hypothetical protein